MTNVHEHRSSNVCEKLFKAEAHFTGEFGLSLRIQAVTYRICDVYWSGCRILEVLRN